MVRVKICGITNIEDAFASVEAGAHLLGFNFYRESPRHIEPTAARRIIERLPASVLSVGVFVNEDSDRVKRVVSESGVGAVQLHGDESRSYCQKFKNLFLIKALRVNNEFDPEEAAQYQTNAVMLDGFSDRAYGGSGQCFDWSVAARTRPLVTKLFLAGGLDTNNVAEAIATVRPYAVDACSGLESAPGLKDHGRIRSFIKAALKAGCSESSL